MRSLQLRLWLPPPSDPGRAAHPSVFPVIRDRFTAWHATGDAVLIGPAGHPLDLVDVAAFETYDQLVGLVLEVYDPHLASSIRERIGGPG